MEKINYEFLCEELRYLGFGDSLSLSLEEKMKEKKDRFELYFSGNVEGEPIDAILYFIRPSLDGFYFFSDYQFTLANKLQHFKIFKGKGVTLKEAYNLLCGRAIFKQLIGRNGQKYKAWMQLDLLKKEGENFKVNIYHESHGYDLSATLDLFPIEAPSSNWDRDMLLRSLQRGNLQSAFLRQESGLKRILIQADPKERTITILENHFSIDTTPTTRTPTNEEKVKKDIVDDPHPKKDARAKKIKR